MKLNVYTDGGARGNPGSAGLGVFITDEDGNKVEARYKSLGVATNNQAECLGAYHGIKRAIELGATDIHLFMDSELIIHQLSGKFKIKNIELKAIYKDISDLLGNWSRQNAGGHITYTHIRREKNKEADRLSNVAMDKNDME